MLLRARYYPGFTEQRGVFMSCTPVTELLEKHRDVPKRRPELGSTKLFFLHNLPLPPLQQMSQEPKVGAERHWAD